MDVVSEVPQLVTELLDVETQEFQLAGDVNQLCQLPILDLLGLTFALGCRWRGHEIRLGSQCHPEQDAFKCAAQQKDRCERSLLTWT